MLVSRNGQFWVCGAIAFLFNLAGCGAMLPLSDNWCSPTYQCPGAGALIEHTMCTYGPKPPADRCHGLRDVQTDEKRTLIVDSLNAARLQLSRGKLSNWPEAADMREISYDYDLEKIALRWAAQCVKGSDKCRRTRDWPHVGQIVSETASDEPIDTDAYWPRDEIRQWLMEAELADPAAIDAYVPNERSARFTQLIWAETYKVRKFQAAAAEIGERRGRISKFRPLRIDRGGRIWEIRPSLVSIANLRISAIYCRNSANSTTFSNEIREFPKRIDLGSSRIV